MRAIVIDQGAARLDAAYPDPRPGAGDVVIRVRRAACSRHEAELATGLHGFRGVPGSDFVGLVEPGAGAGSWAGKRVVCSPVAACARCDLCVAGLSVHCRNRSIIGLLGRDGAMAERVAVPLRNLVEVSSKVDDDQAVFAVAAASAVHASRQLAIEGKPYITVLGDGRLGLLTVQVMAKLNASVRLVGRFSEKLALCEKWGIKHRHVDDVGRRADQDIVVDCTGSPDGLALAMKLVRPRGKIVLKSICAPQPRRASHPPDFAPLVFSEIELIGSFFGPVGEALALIERRELDVVSLISRRMSLSDGAAILKAAAMPDSVCVLVDP